ncbi:MAG TPA: TAXI family TRAP transporter solute-binding subunit, partial [Candidatus Saccharimonadia bacterium]|nr:TAXI family TRAP transporter solute-binding subunit [Candidatus Saccharimonadia bacterium]
MPNLPAGQDSEYVAPTHLTAAAGGRGGSWYVLLEGLASLIHEICPALTITVVEGGGVLNHALVGAGQLPIALIATLEGLGWTAAYLPAGAYGIVAEPIATVAMGTSLGFHASVPTDVVFAITRALCEHPERVRDIHPAATQFDPAPASLQAGGALHPGAERYF